MFLPWFSLFFSSFLSPLPHSSSFLCRVEILSYCFSHLLVSSYAECLNVIWGVIGEGVVGWWWRVMLVTASKIQNIIIFLAIPLPNLRRHASLSPRLSTFPLLAELNGYSETVSKKSMPIQPQVVTVPAEDDHDRYSQYSRHSERPRTRGGFQL